jgi:hypothetical protein
MVARGSSVHPAEPRFITEHDAQATAPFGGSPSSVPHGIGKNVQHFAGPRGLGKMPQQSSGNVMFSREARNAHRSQILVKQGQSRVRRQRFVARRQLERQNRL